jgi:hypothetical protein
VSKKLKSDKESNKIIDYFTVNHRFIINNNGYGTNKTRSIIHSINSNPDLSFVYFAPRHDLLQEVSQQLTIQHTIWEGWSRKCKYKTGTRLRLINAGVPASIICHHCQHKSTCPYVDQFKTRTNILAPTTYVNYPAKLSGVSADVYFFDESISAWEALTDQDVEADENADQIISRMITTNDVDDLIFQAKKLKQIQFIEAKFELRTPANPIYYPRLYRIFRLLRQKKKVIIADANLSRDEFDILINRYPEQCRLPNPYWVPPVSECQPLKLKVYQPFSDAFTKTYFDQYMGTHSRYIAAVIKGLRQQGKKVCVVTFKEKEWGFAGSEWLTGNDVFHFGASSGLNRYRDYDVLVAIGSFWENPKAAADYHSYLTGAVIEISNWQADYYKLPQSTRDLFEQRQTALNLEAILRIRPDPHRGKLVILFCRTPEFLKRYDFLDNRRRMEEELGLFQGGDSSYDLDYHLKIFDVLATSRTKTEAAQRLGWTGRKYTLLRLLDEELRHE